MSPATKAALICLTQERQRVCINNELDARARTNVLGASGRATLDDPTSVHHGKFQYDNRTQRLLRGPTLAIANCAGADGRRLAGYDH